MIAFMHKINKLHLLNKLSTINESNLEDIEMSIYALRGLAGARGCEDDALFESANRLLRVFDNLVMLDCEGKEEELRSSIEVFKIHVKKVR